MTAHPDSWHRTFFTDLYTHFDPEFRDGDLTRTMVEFVNRQLAAAPGRDVLDLACGTGRHSVPLAGLGYRVTGVDLNACYLAQARTRAEGAGQDVRFVESDMRDLGALGSGSQDAVLSLHTSFGFFRNEDDNARVLREARRVLRPGGLLLIDVTNRDWFLHQSPETFGVGADEFVIRTFDSSTGTTYLHEELFDPRTSRIRWSVTAMGATESAVADYRVYSAHELAGICEGTGFQVDSFLGGYGAEPFHPHAPQLICIAHATEEPPD
jgi:ubiquinone/menaquinone biosynthesis C-methylase UbiE